MRYLLLWLFILVLSINLIPAQAGLNDIFKMFVGDSNCYLYGFGDEAVLIDASISSSVIKPYTKEIKFKYILITHGHWDHVSKIVELKSALGAKVIIHKADYEILMEKYPNAWVDAVCQGGETIRVGRRSIKIIHTPGHSKGSVCYLTDDDILFSGDTLFKNSIGRTDLPGGDTQEMKSSLSKLLELKNRVTVCPGHGEMTTMRLERENNPFLK